MAIGDKVHVGDVILQDERERAAFAEQLIGLEDPGLLIQLAEDYCFKVGFVDIIIEELSRRLLDTQNTQTEQLLRQAKEHVEQCRATATELMSSSNPIARQTILPAEIKVIGNDETEHALRFSALQLALTGELTQEGKVLSALKHAGFLCSVTSCNADGHVYSYEMREHPNLHTNEQGGKYNRQRDLGPTAFALTVMEEATQVAQQRG